MSNSELTVHSKINDKANPKRYSAFATTQGHKRVLNEDYAVVSVENLIIATVCDGHSPDNFGDSAFPLAKWVAEELTEIIRKKYGDGSNNLKDYLANGFIECELELHDMVAFRNLAEHTGTTAVAVVITPDQKCFVANAGDSRAVLSGSGGIKMKTRDHTWSENGEEIKRVEPVKDRFYINGDTLHDSRPGHEITLETPRAIGDFGFKDIQFPGDPVIVREKQVVIADADVSEWEINDESEFIIVASDGVWDSIEEDLAVQYVRHLLVRNSKSKVEPGKLLEDTCREFLELCLATKDFNTKRRGTDHLTVVLLPLLNRDESFEQWRSYLVRRASVDRKTMDRDRVLAEIKSIETPKGAPPGFGFRETSTRWEPDPYGEDDGI